jgi:hypothetical protein
MSPIIGMLFILSIALGTVAAVVVGLFAVGALFDALDHPEQLHGRLDGLFKRPPAAPKQTAADHYYRPHWR